MLATAIIVGKFVYLLSSSPISITFSANVSKSVNLRGNHGTLSTETFHTLAHHTALTSSYLHNTSSGTIRANNTDILGVLAETFNDIAYLVGILGIKVNKEIIIPFLGTTGATAKPGEYKSVTENNDTNTYDSIRVREMSMALMAAKQLSRPPILSWIAKHKVVFKFWLVFAGDMVDLE